MNIFLKTIGFLFLTVNGIIAVAQPTQNPTFYSNRQINFNHPNGAYTNQLLQDDFGNGTYPASRGFAAIENGVYKITFNKAEKVNNTGAAVQLKIQPAKQYTLAYRIKYDANFQQGLHGKQFGFVIGVGYDGGRGEEARKNGNGGSVRLQFDAQDSTISNQLYVYHTRMKGKYGENPGNQKFYFKKGAWNTIKMTVTMQSSNQSADGKIEIWCNGIKKIQVDSMLFVRDETASRITKLSFESFPGGGGAVPLYDNYVYVDDVRWYREDEKKNDASIIKSKLYQINLAQEFKDEYSTDQNADSLIKTITPSGNWPDINYLDKTDSRWQPAEHWFRLVKLSVDYKNEKSGYYKNCLLKNAILNGIRYWIREKPKANNYWWDVIGVPGYLGSVLILMEDELDEFTLKGGVELLMLGVKPAYYDYHGKATGQNLLWIATAHLYAACLTNDQSGLERVFASVADEIVITEKEGIQPDYSFYQHGPQNYALGYGKGFSNTAVRFIYLANQTSFQFSQDKINIISHYILDGQQWMTRNGFLEYSAMGREISRQKIDKGNMLVSLRWMKEVDTLRANEFYAYYQRLSESNTSNPLIGNKYFWRSDLMVHQRPHYYFSLKNTSSRILSSESGNGENIKGYFQGHGTYYLVRNGNEYKNIFPLWNWRKIPGVLVPQVTAPLPLFNWGEGARGNTSFVYGISDSMYGCFGSDYNKDGVTARRSWFLFDKEIVCLLNNVKGDSLYQSINQSLSKGEMWMKRRRIDKRPITMVHHDSTGYVIDPNSYKVLLEQEQKSGSWKEINLAASADLQAAEVFTLGIDLVDVEPGASFWYAIIPGISLSHFKRYRQPSHFAILQNNDQVQAVYQKDIQQVQAVFFTGASLLLPWNKKRILMKKPGLLLIKKTNNQLQILFGEGFPSQQVSIHVDGKGVYENEYFKIVH
jgi:chondroitin AC lyase